MFENAKENGLLDIWPIIQDDPFKKFGIRIEKTKYPITKKDDDIFNFFMLMKLVPTPRYSFDKSTKALLIFSEVKFVVRYLLHG